MREFIFFIAKRFKMKKIDLCSALGFMLAVCLLIISFIWHPFNFWVLFPLSLFILSIYSWIFEKPTLQRMSLLQWLLGILSGIFLYLIFAFGKWLIVQINIPLMNQLEDLYTLVKPTKFLHYVWLFFVIIPVLCQL